MGLYIPREAANGNMNWNIKTVDDADVDLWSQATNTLTRTWFEDNII